MSSLNEAVCLDKTINELELLIIRKIEKSGDDQAAFDLGTDLNILKGYARTYDSKSAGAEVYMEKMQEHYDALNHFVKTGEYISPESKEKVETKKTNIAIEILKLGTVIEDFGNEPFYAITHPNTVQSKDEHLRRTLDEFFCIKRFSESGQSMVYGCNTAEFMAVKRNIDSLYKEQDFSDKTTPKEKREILGITPPEKSDTYHHEKRGFGSVDLVVNFTFHNMDNSPVPVMQEYKGFIECFPDFDNQLALTALKTLNRKGIFDAYRKETGKQFFDTRR